MYKRCIKAMAILAVLVVSLISISSSAVPHAMSDLYKGECGAELSVPAPGILKNDIKSFNPLQVQDPETISIDPRYGTLTVNEDGSFFYEAAENIAPGTYVTFKYSATDGSKTTNRALVKIQISCACRGTAPDVTVCPGTKITPRLLIEEGALCTGCRDVKPKFDLRKIPAHPAAGACYPYTLSCLGCGVVKGNVCFEGCDFVYEPMGFSIPVENCPDVLPTEEQIIDLAGLECTCDSAPQITDIKWIEEDEMGVLIGEYTATCGSGECGSSITGQFEARGYCEQYQ
jgi:hypothetical protein